METNHYSITSQKKIYAHLKIIMYYFIIVFLFSKLYNMKQNHTHTHAHTREL